jgi:hypothetical protein
MCVTKEGDRYNINVLYSKLDNVIRCHGINLCEREPTMERFSLRVTHISGPPSAALLSRIPKSHTVTVQYFLTQNQNQKKAQTRDVKTTLSVSSATLIFSGLRIRTKQKTQTQIRGFMTTLLISVPSFTGPSPTFSFSRTQNQNRTKNSDSY